MTAVSTVRKPATIVRPTGAPPPLVQIADQARSSSGATYGRAARLTPSWHRAAVGRTVQPRVVAPAEPVVAPPFSPGSDHGHDAELLLDLLRQIAGRGERLPRLADLAIRLVGEGRTGVASMVHNRLRAMAGSGVIKWAYGGSGPHHGEMVIRIAACGSELRTARAPASWQVPV